MLNKSKYLIYLCIIAFSIILISHNIDIAITSEDKEFIPKFLFFIEQSIIANKNVSYKDELQFILQVQYSVLKVAPGTEGLPTNSSRDPKQLYIYKTGECYDKSRVMEKIFRFSGFKVRHVILFSTQNASVPIFALFQNRPQTVSHSVCEVLTSKGWLVVDNNSPWISLDVNEKPMSTKQMRRDVGNNHIIWKHPPPFFIFKVPFIFIYGFYSRHGKFYPPYDFIPDVNYSELFQNFTN